MKRTPMKCQYCKGLYDAKRTDSKFCSAACKQNAYLDRIRGNVKEKGQEPNPRHEQFSQTIRQLEKEVTALRKFKDEQLRYERHTSSRPLNNNDDDKVSLVERDSKTLRNINQTNGILKEWFRQLLNFQRQERVLLFKIKSLCSEIIEFSSSRQFNDLPKDYIHLKFLTDILFPKIKHLYEGFNYSKERFVYLQLSDELKVKFNQVIGSIDG